MIEWSPELAEGSGLIYERLVAALGRDIASGALPPGTKLPTHRDLAYRLGIGVGTVTKAYADAEARGLIAAHVGRGSFVADRNDMPAGPAFGDGRIIDLSRNIVPSGTAAQRVRDAFGKLRRRSGLEEHLYYAPPAGIDSHRRAAAAWLARTANFADVDWRNLICCAGALQATALALGSVCRPGDTVLTESSTFFGVKSLADQCGYRLQGLPMDAEGLLPEALDRAAAAGARVLHTIPTLQNPTGRIMRIERRRQIAEVARRHGLHIVEDDIYAVFVRDMGLPPLATFAPELTLYVSSMSKILAPGLRAGYLVTPPGRLHDKALQVMRAYNYSPPVFGSLIATQWIEDGTADVIAEEVVANVDERSRLAERILEGVMEPVHGPRTLHTWLPMTELEAERVAGRTLRDGVKVTPPGAPLVGGPAETGVRLGIGAAPDLPALERALLTVRRALTEENDAQAMDVI